jgi:hypothetical protein
MTPQLNLDCLTCVWGTPSGDHDYSGSAVNGELNIILN